MEINEQHSPLHSTGEDPRVSHHWWFSLPMRTVTQLLQVIISQSVMIAMRVFAKITVTGTEHLREVEEIRKQGGKFIIISNHTGDLDVLIMRGIFGTIFSRLTPLYAVALEKKHYTNFGPIRSFIYSQFVFKLLGAHPAYPGHHNYKYALPTHEHLLQNGNSVIIFPEGGATKTGRVKEGKGGVGYLAIETRAHILPLTIIGTWKASPWKFFSFRSHYVVSIGKPITPNEIDSYTVHADHQRYKDIGKRLMKDIEDRFWELRERYPTAKQTLSEVWTKDEFSGEHVKKHPILTCATIIVGYMAAISNIIKASYRYLRTSGSSSFMKIAWEMGRDEHHYSLPFLDGLSHWNHTVKVNASSWQSLEPFYGYHTRTIKEHEEELKKMADAPMLTKLKTKIAVKLSQYWMGHSHNRQALLNRLKISIILLDQEIKQIPHGETIRIISIASGSAKAVVEAVLRNPDRHFDITLIDLDPEALRYAKALAEEHHIAHFFTYVNDTASSVERIGKENKAHIIEMVGFLDYRNHKQSVSISRAIHESLRDGGVYLCANVQDNHEKILLDWGLLWPMIYKDDDEYYRIMNESGFEDKDIRLIHEPFHIHIISVAKRNSKKDNGV